MPKRTTFSCANAGIGKAASALAPTTTERRDSFIEGSRSEFWSVRSPGRGAFVGGTGGKNTGLVEGPSCQLEGERIALATEAAADRRRRLAGDVERHGERRLAEEVEDRLRLLEGLRCTPVVGRHDEVVAAHRRARVARELAPESP